MPHVFAIGDAAAEAPHERPELTPVAIRAGRLLARRMVGGATATLESGGAHSRLGASAIPTAVFGPTEYACVGFSEEEAREALGDALEVYHAHYTPLEWELTHRPHNTCYAKVCVRRARPSPSPSPSASASASASPYPGDHERHPASP